MNTIDDPTRQTYATLQAAMHYFNKTLFAGQLPPCLVSFQRRANTYGYYARDKFEHRDDRSATSELALNPKHFNERTPEETLSTLVHELVHHWQRCFGKPGRGAYHNVEWGSRMEAIGLMPSSTGAPGGKRTGDRVSHYIIEGGPFDLACKAFLMKHEGLLWGDRPVEPATGGKRSKYVCPDTDCKIAAWARPGVRLLCGEHEGTGMVMTEVASPSMCSAQSTGQGHLAQDKQRWTQSSTGGCS
jgi:predicted SprT family Zn-dependent metalloprotease